jgi:hypothetical protein
MKIRKCLRCGHASAFVDPQTELCSDCAEVLSDPELNNEPQKVFAKALHLTPLGIRVKKDDPRTVVILFEGRKMTRRAMMAIISDRARATRGVALLPRQRGKRKSSESSPLVEQ